MTALGLWTGRPFWGKPAEPVKYLIAPLLAEGEITRVYAQAKVGKSLLIQECAAALATGRPVLGQQVEPLTVVYIDPEADWKTRLSDMGYGPDDDFHRFHWYSLQGGQSSIRLPVVRRWSPQWSGTARVWSCWTRRARC